MKRIELFICLLALVSCGRNSVDSRYVQDRDGIGVTVFQTTESSPLHKIRTTPFTIHGYSEIGYLDLDSTVTSHEYKGIGVS